jgi:hypothetical protein
MQLSACTLLVRMCGLQPWWGDFLAKTITRLYSSQNTSIFPQDRYVEIIVSDCTFFLHNQLHFIVISRNYWPLQKILSQKRC